MSLYLKVLGCSGSEAKGVKPCSFLLGDTVLFDAGCIASELSIEAQQHIQHIYLTHCHLDHIKDLAFFAENVFSLVRESVQVHAPAAVLKSIQQHLFNNEIWPDFTKLPSATKPVLKFSPLENGAHTIHAGTESIQLTAIPVNHPGPTVGYIIEGSKRALVYTGDTGPTDKMWQQVNQNNKITDILLEASFPNRLSDLAKDSLHLTPAGLQSEMKKINNRNIMIHVYHMKAPYQLEIEQELKNINNPKIRTLVAGDRFELA